MSPTPNPLPSDENPKVFDVAKPGEITPPGTSRPVIAPKGPAVPDPTVIHPSDDRGLGTHKNPGLSVPDSVKKDPKEDKPTPKDGDVVANGGSESGSIAALTEAAQQNKQSDKDAEADALQRAELDRLAESKEFFVPLGHGERVVPKSHVPLVAIIIVIAIAVAGATLIFLM